MVLFYQRYTLWIKQIDLNIRPEKQDYKVQLCTPQTPIIPETKIISHVKPRIGQGRTGIKRKMLTFPVSQPYDKPKQPKLLPGRKTIIQIVKRLILQQP